MEDFEDADVGGATGASATENEADGRAVLGIIQVGVFSQGYGPGAGHEKGPQEDFHTDFLEPASLHGEIRLGSEPGKIVNCVEWLGIVGSFGPDMKGKIRQSEINPYLMK
jgi:hypothetical protein